AADLVFAWVRDRICGGGVSEGIGDRQGVMLDDVLTGLEVPPEVGVGGGSREEAEQAGSRESDGCDLQPAGWRSQRRGLRRRSGSLATIAGPCWGTRTGLHGSRSFHCRGWGAVVDGRGERVGEGVGGMIRLRSGS